MKLELQAGPRDASICIIDCCYHATLVADGISTVKHFFRCCIFIHIFFFEPPGFGHDHNSIFMFGSLMECIYLSHVGHTFLPSVRFLMLR